MVCMETSVRCIVLCALVSIAPAETRDSIDPDRSSHIVGGGDVAGQGMLTGDAGRLDSHGSLKTVPKRAVESVLAVDRSVGVNALIRSSPGISSGKLANLANSVSEKIDAGTAVSSDWSRGFPSLSLRYRL